VKGNKIQAAIKELEENVESVLKKNETPGLAVAIFSHDKIHCLKGFGVKRLGRVPPELIKPTTLFQAASISKPICATLLALFVEEGLCSLNDHPAEFLPHIFSKEKHTGLTLAHMLNHTSGLSYNDFEELIELYIPRQEILQKLQEAPSIAKSGEHYEYHNVVYGLIEDIISVITKQSFESVLQDKIFKPLGMKHASVGFPALLEASDRAYPHVENEQGGLDPAAHYSHAYYIFSAAGGINLSVSDLIPFAQLYMTQTPHLLSKKTLDVLQSPTIEAMSSLPCVEDPRGMVKKVWYGLGWMLMNYGTEHVVYHTGWLNGFRSFMGILPAHDMAIVILSNTNRKVSSRLALDFFHHYLNEKDRT